MVCNNHFVACSNSNFAFTVGAPLSNSVDKNGNKSLLLLLQGRNIDQLFIVFPMLKIFWQSSAAELFLVSDFKLSRK